MTISEAKRRANAKWDRENMKTLGTRIKRADADLFASICDKHGLTVSAALAAYIKSCNQSNSLTSASTLTDPIPNTTGP